MKRKYGESVRPPHEECTSCGNIREVWRRNPRVLCRNCSVRLFPGQRKRAICANFLECKNSLSVQEIRARGLCNRCYDRIRLDGKLNEWPLVRG